VLPLIPIAYMPSPLPRQVRRNLFARTVPSSSAFPVLWAGRPLHYAFRGLLSVHSHYGLHARRVAIATLYTEGSNGFVASTAASIATGWNEPVPGRVYLPLWISAFHGAPQRCTGSLGGGIDYIQHILLRRLCTSSASAF
jgi:hypothetical protein